MDDQDFEYMDQSRIDGATTIDYEFVHLHGRPILRVAPATSENAAFSNAVALVLQAERLRAKPDDKKTPAQEEARKLYLRLRDAKLIVETCAKSWVRRPVLRLEKQADGSEMPVFLEEGPAGMLRFLEHLAKRAPNVFDDFRTYIQMTDNFYKVSFAAAVETAGNSAGG